MNTYAKLAIAAAAVVVVAVVGINLPASGGVGGGGGGPAPSPSPTPSPTPSPSPAAVFPLVGPLAIGRHPLTVEGVPLSFSVPAGWSVDNNTFFVKDTEVAGDQAAILVWSPVNPYSDPCAKTPLSPVAGPSAADLASAISTAHGTAATEPSDVAVGGRATKYVVLTVTEDTGCFGEDQHFYLWYNDCAGSPSADADACFRYATAPGDTIRTWIVDVDGARLVIEAETRKVAGPEIEQEIQQIIDSIQFE